MEPFYLGGVVDDLALHPREYGDRGALVTV